MTRCRRDSPPAGEERALTQQRLPGRTQPAAGDRVRPSCLQQCHLHAGLTHGRQTLCQEVTAAQRTVASRGTPTPRPPPARGHGTLAGTMVGRTVGQAWLHPWVPPSATLPTPELLILWKAEVGGRRAGGDRASRHPRTSARESPSFRYHLSQAQSLVSLTVPVPGVARDTPTRSARPLAPALPLAACTHPLPVYQAHNRPLCPGACGTVPPHPRQAVPGSLGDCRVLGGNRRDLLVVIYFFKVGH